MAGRRIVVTGASSGIGLALARRLMRAGDDVIAVDRVASPAPVSAMIQADLVNAEQLPAVLSVVNGPLHGLANVAGVPGTAAACQVLSVNVLGTKRVTELIRPLLVPGSCVVNVASLAAHRNLLDDQAVASLLQAGTREELNAWLTSYPLTGPQAYDTSKAAIITLTSRLAAGCLGAGVRAVSVSPGPTQTPILGEFQASMGAERFDQAAALVGRHGRADEIAAVIAFLLSPDASWVNGIDIGVDGGLQAARAVSVGSRTGSGR